MVSKSKFKPRALAYFREVEVEREEVIVTDHGRPVAKIIPYTSDPSHALKTLRCSVIAYTDPTKPVGIKDWEILT